jgi:VanZ family protein
MPRFWRAAFVVQLVAVVAIATGAYLGRLPTFYQRIPHADLVAHAVLFGLLAGFLDGALGHRPLLRGRLPWLRLAPVVVLAVAAVEEIAQRLSPRRTSSFSDYAADLVGVVLFVWLAGRVTAWHERRQGTSRPGRGQS